MLSSFEHAAAVRAGADAGALASPASMPDGLGLMGPRVSALHLHLSMGRHSSRIAYIWELEVGEGQNRVGEESLEREGVGDERLEQIFRVGGI